MPTKRSAGDEPAGRAGLRKRRKVPFEATSADINDKAFPDDDYQDGSGSESNGSSGDVVMDESSLPSAAVRPRKQTLKRVLPLAPAPVPGSQVGGFSFEEARLQPVLGMSPAELEVVKRRMNNEVQQHAMNPPALPATMHPPLPQKPVIDDPVVIPEGISEQERRRLEATNNRVAEERKKLDKKRNSLSAARTRKMKDEKIANYGEMLNAKSAECVWLRLKLAALGADPTEWDTQVPIDVKRGMIGDIEKRVKVIYDRREEEEKAGVKDHRLARNKTINQKRAASSKSWSPEGDFRTPGLTTASQSVEPEPEPEPVYVAESAYHIERPKKIQPAGSLHNQPPPSLSLQLPPSNPSSRRPRTRRQHQQSQLQHQQPLQQPAQQQGYPAQYQQYEVSGVEDESFYQTFINPDLYQAPNYAGQQGHFEQHHVPQGTQQGADAELQPLINVVYNNGNQPRYPPQD